MAKKLSVAKEAEKAATLLQLLVRLEGSDDNGYCSCVTCGDTRHYKDAMQGGHYMSRGNSITKLDEDNIWPQCKGCNGFGMKYGDKEKAYTIFMIDKFGRDFVDDLHASKFKPFKWNRADIEEKQKDFKERIAIELERVGG